MANGSIDNARRLEVAISCKERRRDELIEEAQLHAKKALELREQARFWQERIDDGRMRLSRMETP